MSGGSLNIIVDKIFGLATRIRRIGGIARIFLRGDRTARHFLKGAVRTALFVYKKTNTDWSEPVFAYSKGIVKHLFISMQPTKQAKKKRVWIKTGHALCV